MKKITIVEDLGYYHPSNANWSYKIHLVIDKKGARLYKDTFGECARTRERLEKEGYTINRLYAGVGSNNAYKWADVKRMLDIRSYQANKNY